MNSQSNYQMLGVKPGCSEEEIKKAYLALAKQYHPDKMQQEGQIPPDQNRNFVGIHNAYQQITQDLRIRKKQHAKNFNDYMKYVNTILNIFHNNSSDS
jgi:molecular chaperone DnaJ